MAISMQASLDHPLSELNTTPLIDVMLVLLVMMILSIPVATHSLPIDLPAPGPIIERPPIQPDRNTVSVTPASVITFNNQPVSAEQLGALLRDTLALRPEPELQFQPDPGAPYNTAAKVLNVIKGSGVSAFGFVGNEQFASFGKPHAASAAAR